MHTGIAKDTKCLGSLPVDGKMEVDITTLAGKRMPIEAGYRLALEHHRLQTACGEELTERSERLIHVTAVLLGLFGLHHPSGEKHIIGQEFIRQELECLEGKRHHRLCLGCEEDALPVGACKPLESLLLWRTSPQSRLQQLQQRCTACGRRNIGTGTQAVVSLHSILLLLVFLAAHRRRCLLEAISTGEHYAEKSQEKHPTRRASRLVIVCRSFHPSLFLLDSILPYYIAHARVCTHV